MKRFILALVSVSALFAQGFPNFTPPTPLFAAVSKGDAAAVKRLLSEGASPNEGRMVAGYTPLVLAAVQHEVEMARLLVEKGADVNAADLSGSTVLMWAAANEAGRVDLVELLLSKRADPNARNKMGESALDWAQRRGQTSVVAALKRAGVSDTARVKASVERAIALLQRSGPQFVKVSGCVSCHHQSLPQMAIGLARERGMALDQALSAQQVKGVLATAKPLREAMLQGTDSIPDIPISISYLMLGLAAENHPADDVTAAAAHLIRAKQQPDGHWHALTARPPMESSHVTGTALSLRTLQLYGNGTEDQERVRRARAWLLKAKAETNEERAMRLLGLAWAQARPEELQKAASALLAEQSPDGGWAQLPTLDSDAYATGQALTALRLSGVVAAEDSAYQRGAAYLLRTQLPDGSWLVRSRSFPVQPLKESGFPHGRDQWISASGTSWAAMALALTVEPIPVTLVTQSE